MRACALDFITTMLFNVNIVYAKYNYVLPLRTKPVGRFSDFDHVVPVGLDAGRNHEA